MERGQRRTSPQSHTGRPRRSAHPTRSANRKRRKNTPKKPWIIGGAILLLLILIVIVSTGGKSVPLEERILGEWVDESGAMFEFFDTGVVGQYIPPQPDLGIDSIITTHDWALQGDILIIGDVSAECSVEAGVLHWGKAEYFRFE